MRTPLRAFIVAVDYTDLLKVSLEYNRHHFSEINVVTSEAYFSEVKTLCEGMPPLLGQSFTIYGTDAFHRNDATFNKWAALEEALDAIGRHGWVCLLDADILWPKEIEWEPSPGFLYSPYRRMFECVGQEFIHQPTPGMTSGFVEQPIKLPYPQERDWWQLPIHRNVNEWAGYTQIFHGSDPHLGSPPWHQTDWKHAGGADSFFQQKWPMSRKLRPPWECLHIGAAGQNWFGRVTPYLDGRPQHPQAEVRKSRTNEIWRNRRLNVAKGKDQFEGERIHPLQD